MFCGYFVLLESMPVWWKYWAPYLSPLNYCLSAAIWTQFQGRNFTNPDLPWKNGDDLLRFYHVEIHSWLALWGYVGILCLFAFVTFFATYWAVRKIKWSQR